MPRIIESTLLSLDGVIGDPHVWAGPHFGAEGQAMALERLLASDGLLMGRRTYEIFSTLWPAATGPYPGRINAIPKYVVSSTLEQPDWANTTVLSWDELLTLDASLMLYGHGPLGQALLEHGLLDALHYLVLPAFVGTGTPLSRPGATGAFHLTGTRVLDGGTVMLSYQP
jgi:dihydrofolate reductase